MFFQNEINPPIGHLFPTTFIALFNNIHSFKCKLNYILVLLRLGICSGDSMLVKTAITYGGLSNREPRTVT